MSENATGAMPRAHIEVGTVVTFHGFEHTPDRAMVTDLVTCLDCGMPAARLVPLAEGMFESWPDQEHRELAHVAHLVAVPGENQAASTVLLGVCVDRSLSAPYHFAVEEDSDGEVVGLSVRLRNPMLEPNRQNAELIKLLLDLFGDLGAEVVPLVHVLALVDALRKALARFRAVQRDEVPQQAAEETLLWVDALGGVEGLLEPLDAIRAEIAGTVQ